MMIDDPIEAEQYLALNAYLCFCSAFGCFMGALKARWLFCVYIDELFYMGAVFACVGLSLIVLADFKVPTKIVVNMLKRRPAF